MRAQAAFGRNKFSLLTSKPSTILAMKKNLSTSLAFSNGFTQAEQNENNKVFTLASVALVIAVNLSFVLAFIF
jgi:hypothetical protein